MPNQVVKAMADRYLLRAEPRAGAIWIELVHDRFVGPIRRANRDAEAKPKELEAAEKARQEAERQRVEAEARASRRLRWLSVALVVVSLVAVVAALLAFGRGSALESANQELKVAQGKIVAEYGARAAVSEATAQAASTQAADLKATVNSGTKVPAATATAQAVAAQAAATQAAAAQATAQADSGQVASARATAQSKTASPTVLNDLWVSSDLDLNLRGQPDSTSNLIARLARGDHLTAIGPQSGPDAGGYVWQQVRTDSNQAGWVVAIGPLGTHLMTRKPDAGVHERAGEPHVRRQLRH